MEKSQLRPGEEIVIGSCRGIDVHFMPRSAPSSGDDEELSIDLKPFIGVTVTAEEEAGLLELNERIGKGGFDLLVWTDYPAVGKGWLVTSRQLHGQSLRPLQISSVRSNTRPFEFHLVLW